MLRGSLQRGLFSCNKKEKSMSKIITRFSPVESLRKLGGGCRRIIHLWRFKPYAYYQSSMQSVYVHLEDRSGVLTNRKPWGVINCFETSHWPSASSDKIVSLDIYVGHARPFKEETMGNFLTRTGLYYDQMMLLPAYTRKKIKRIQIDH